MGLVNSDQILNQKLCNKICDKLKITLINIRKGMKEWMHEYVDHKAKYTLKFYHNSNLIIIFYSQKFIENNCLDRNTDVLLLG